MMTMRFMTRLPCTVRRLLRRALGWSSQNAPRDDMPVTAFRLEGENGPEYWMGLKNFYAITRYNRSVMYAMAVHQLSDMLVQARGVK